MADKVDEKIENEVCTKKKDVESPVKDKAISDEKPEKENGTVFENENGGTEETEETDNKESDVASTIKRKSGAGDQLDEKTADDATPEKKAKLDEADVESNAEAEISA